MTPDELLMWMTVHRIGRIRPGMLLDSTNHSQQMSRNRDPTHQVPIIYLVQVSRMIYSAIQFRDVFLSYYILYHS